MTAHAKLARKQMRMLLKRRPDLRRSMMRGSGSKGNRPGGGANPQTEDRTTGVMAGKKREGICNVSAGDLAAALAMEDLEDGGEEGEEGEEGGEEGEEGEWEEGEEEGDDEEEDDEEEDDDRLAA